MLRVLFASVLLLGPSPASTGDSRPPSVIENEVLRVVSEATIARPDTVFNFIGVAVDGDVVTLSGTVRHASRGRQIEREVAKIAGVREVRNRLHAPALGAGDERIRRQLVRAIYGHPSLSRYGLHAEPPIRILVERGKVVLAGRVASRVERELLTQIAHRSEAFEVENAVVVDAEVANVPVGGAGVHVPKAP